MDLRVLQNLEFISSRLSNLERRLEKMDEKLDFSLALQRNHLIRIKNGEDIDDGVILYGRPYNDLSPQQAFSITENPDLEFIVLDVSREGHDREVIEGQLSIPLEQVQSRAHEIKEKSIPILVISEKGLRSILACEYLVRKGLYNVNNVSGGHEFWPGHIVGQNKNVSSL